MALTAGVAGAAVLLVAWGDWISPVASERLYGVGTPLGLFWWVFAARGRRRRRLAIVLVVAAGAAGADYGLEWGPFRRGEIVRAVACLAGYGCLLAAIRSAGVRLLVRLLPAGALQRPSVRLPVTVLWIIAVALISHPYLLAYLQVHPLRGRDDGDPRLTLGLDYRKVAFRSFDRTRLVGWFVPAGLSRRTAVVCHGVMDTKSGLLDLIDALHHGGYHVLAFDMRGHGESDRWTVTYGAREWQDIVAAIDYLTVAHPESAEQIVGVGWSMGGASMVLAAAVDLRIRAIHIEAPYAGTRQMAAHLTAAMPAPLSWWSCALGTAIASLEAGADLFALDITAAARQLSPRPLMIVHGTADPIVPIEQGRQVFAAAGAPKFFHAIEGAGHCARIARSYYERMLAFLDGALDANSGPVPASS